MKSNQIKSCSVPQKKIKLESFNRYYFEKDSFLEVIEHEQPDITQISYDYFLRKKPIQDDVFGGFESESDKKHLPEPNGFRLLSVNYLEDREIIRESLKKKTDTPTYYRDEESIKKFYFDINSTIEKHYNEWTIWVNDDHSKIKLSFFEAVKKRLTQCRFFKKPNDKTPFKTPSIIIHPETGNFYISSNKTVRCNSLLRLYGVTHRLNKEYMYSYDHIRQLGVGFFDDRMYYNEVKNLILEKNPEFEPKNFYFKSNPLFGLITEFFFYKKGIELNEKNLHYYFKFFPGTKTKRQKYFNMDEEILKKNGLNHKNKYLRRLVSSGTVDIDKLKWFVTFFGDDYAKFLNSIKNKNFFISKFKESDLTSYNRESRWYMPDNFTSSYGHLMTKKTKENVIKIIDTLDDKIDGTYFCSDLIDHLRMLVSLKEVFPDIEFNAQSYNGFKLEHTEFSTKQSLITKRFITNYQYGDKTLKVIEEPLLTVSEDQKQYTFYPYILKTENDYIEEGLSMRHCVGGYTYKKTSIIVSIRNLDGSKRVTCEYNISDGRVIQERYVKNQPPPEEFKDALAMMYIKVMELAKLGTLNWVKQETIPNVVNGVDIQKLREDANKRWVDRHNVEEDGLVPF